MAGPESFSKSETVHNQEGVGKYQGTVGELETPERKQAIPGLKLPERWVVWVKVAKKEFDPSYMHDRVCIGRITDNGTMMEEMMPQRIRSLLVKEYFSEIPGNPISYSPSFDSTYTYNKALPESLPEQYRAEEFSDILSWFMHNRPQILEDSCRLLRERQPKRESDTT